jgi:urea transport system permease protein
LKPIGDVGEMRVRLLISIFAALVLCAPAPAAAAEEALSASIEDLKSKSFRTKGAAVDVIAESGGDAARRILSALLDGRLKIQKTDGTVVVVDERASVLHVTDASTGAALGTAEKSTLKKIIINNKMRGKIRTSIARLSLRASDVGVRLRAVKSLYDSLSPETARLLRESLFQERDDDVQDAIRVALALVDLDSAQLLDRRAAISVLSGSVHMKVRNRLVEVVGSDSDGVFNEADPEVRKAAAAAIETIDSWRNTYALIETIFFGLSLGFVLVLSAAGLAITFGVMGVINMAHGELMMLGAYSTWVVQQAMPGQLEVSLLVAIPVAFAVSALVGVVIERGVVSSLYGRPLETLLATFGVSLVLQQTVRSVFSPLNRAVASPEWMSGQLVINDALAFTNNRLYIIVFSICVFLLLVALLRFTTLGLQIRAVSQNRDMARAMGVRGGWIDAVTFGLGAGVAGLAGVALSQLTNVGPNLGQSHIVDSFMVVVFGGVGNLWGTLVAGLSLGIVNKFLEPFVGAVLAKILVLVFIILFIQRRPRGLFPQQGRAAEA